MRKRKIKKAPAKHFVHRRIYYWAAGKRKADAFSIGFSPPKYMVEVKGA